MATLLTMDIITAVVLSHDADLQRQDPAAPHPLFTSFMALLKLVRLLVASAAAPIQTQGLALARARSETRAHTHTHTHTHTHRKTTT